MENKEEKIKAMKLYLRPDRIYDELRNHMESYDNETALKVEEVSLFDNWHYFGTKPIDKAIMAMGIKPHHKVLDIGSGIGGPARYLSYRTGCQVLGVELQEDACAIATDLTKRCGMEEKVKFRREDIFQVGDDELGQFDFIVSWFVFLHISNKDELFKKCSSFIKPGGTMYIEDYFRRGEFSSAQEIACLKSTYAINLPTEAIYKSALENNGFTVKIFEDVTPAWSKFCHERVIQHNMADVKAERSRIYGEETWENLRIFFTAVDTLFKGGHYCGAHITCVKN